MTFTVVPDHVRETARTARTTGGLEPDDLKALRAGKTIFIEGANAEKRVRSLRVTLAYHRDRGNEKRSLCSRQVELDGKTGKVVWLEENASD